MIGDWKSNIKSETAPAVQKSTTSIAVPPCDTQVFHGDYVNWPSFRDLFTAIYVNNKRLSPVEKLYHLFQKKAGEAREINRNIPLTSEGFEIAWDNLKSQYENKKILINSQLRILFILPQCTNESASGLKKLQREITNCISVLKLLNIEIGTLDPIFVYQCSSKLPKLTLSLWEQSIAKNSEIPKWEELDNFVTERYHILEGVSDMITGGDTNPLQRYNIFDKSRQYKVHHTKISEQRCPICKGNHMVKSCTKFVSMNFKSRLTAVKRSHCCINCLAQGHIAVACTSKNRCAKCNAKHHTLMHKENIVSRDCSDKSIDNSNLSQNDQNQS
ncbi:uncharacterized protein LOC142227367 [Haematobia irritans]|uniref:uncharacterized protein LOC142227367 n=1 Tax=Haematobia irritans TaxID=7368 RepID=UPI003F5013D9